MDFYYTQSSPYANCVRIIIAEIGISEQINFIESHPFENSPNFLLTNPLGKVPCLNADGESIVDSEVICDFLDASFTGGTLFNPIYADWRLKSLFSVCIGLIDTLVARQMEIMRKKEELLSDFWWQRQQTAIERTLGYIEEKLSLIPEEITILHIYLMSALMYLDFRHADINWRESHPQLASFFEHWKNHPSIMKNPLQ